MKKINFKQPKYVFPLVILLPIVFLAFQTSVNSSVAAMTLPRMVW